MNSSEPISLLDLSLILIPLISVKIIRSFWGLKIKQSLIATIRMITQLLLVGFALEGLFTNNDIFINIFVLLIMLISASLIALRSSQHRNKRDMLFALGSIALGGIPILVLVVSFILKEKISQSPSVVIPIAGMIFSAGMNALSVGYERFENDLKLGEHAEKAATVAFEAAMIPMTNTFLAVGLVSLPGMMTGQILSGTPPLIAVRYQIVVMAMTYSSAALSTAAFLKLKVRWLRSA